MPNKDFRKLITAKQLKADKKYMDLIITLLLEDELYEIYDNQDIYVQSYAKTLLSDTGILHHEGLIANLFTDDENLNSIFGTIARYFEQATVPTALEPLYRELRELKCGFRITKEAIPFFIAVVFNVYSGYVNIYQKSKREILTINILKNTIIDPSKYYVICSGICESPYLHKLYKVFNNNNIKPDFTVTAYDVYYKMKRWYKELPVYAKLTDIIYNGNGKEHYQLEEIYKIIKYRLCAKDAEHIRFLLKDLTNILYEHYQCPISHNDIVYEMKIFKQYLDNLYPSMIYTIMREISGKLNNEKSIIEKYIETYSDSAGKEEQNFIMNLGYMLDSSMIKELDLI